MEKKTIKIEKSHLDTLKIQAVKANMSTAKYLSFILAKAAENSEFITEKKENDAKND